MPFAQWNGNLVTWVMVKSSRSFAPDSLYRRKDLAQPWEEKERDDTDIEEISLNEVIRTENRMTQLRWSHVKLLFFWFSFSGKYRFRVNKSMIGVDIVAWIIRKANTYQYDFLFTLNVSIKRIVYRTRIIQYLINDIDNIYYLRYHPKSSSLFKNNIP